MMESSKLVPGGQGASIQDQPPVSNHSAPAQQSASTSLENTQLCRRAQLDESTIDLCANSLRALRTAGQHETVETGDRTLGKSICFKWAYQLRDAGLLTQLDKRTLRITDAGRAYLEAHPQQPGRGIYGTTADPGASAEYRYKLAVSDLAHLVISKATGRCYACMGAGFHDGDGNRGREYGTRSRLSEDDDCAVCGGSGKAPNTYAYRDWLASIRKKLDVIITAHQHADRAVRS